MPTRRATPPLLLWFLLLAATARAGEPPTVVLLGDSITKGVREGVRPEETFGALVEADLSARLGPVRVVNLGVGGERTDQALGRLDAVAAQRPRVVAVMYGTNDSYVDPGEDASRLTVEAYRANLSAIVAGLLRRGIEPILMTPPRWADDAKDGRGANPNVALEPFADACRAVARACRVPLVDHYARWAEARANGQDLKGWTTDGCHPDPRGHRVLADAIRPALLDALVSDTPVVPFETELTTVLEHDDGRFLWYHPRAAAIPKPGGGPPGVLMTLQKHLSASDHYSGLSMLRSDDLGRTWAGPEAVAELDWVREPGGVDVAVADVTPGWHAPTGKVLAVGAQVRYNAKGDQLEDRERSNQTAYAVFDPKIGRWTPWRRLEMPPGDAFRFARSACAQFVVEPDGSVLLPLYIGRSADEPYAVTVARCAFDGDALTYREHGDVLTLGEARGLYEPSLIRAGGRYFLTIRNDLRGYVTAGDDGLHYRPAKAWTFDDGAELGCDNTQQHWLARGDALFLAYTRRGADNDHIPRHRAPLFLAQVDPRRLHVLRATERVVVPERGAELGNFGANSVDDRESWVTVAEGLWDAESRRRGGKGAVFVARVRWRDPAPTPAPHPEATRKALAAGGPVRVACLGDSVTGIYYHTGSRRAYPEMLALALRRAFPNAGVETINAGVSGNTTADALARLDRDVLAKAPTLVTVMFGLNDMTRVPLDAYRANLAEIAARCRAAGAEVLFCTPNNVITTDARPSERLLAYVEAMRAVGRERGVPVCDVYAATEAFRDRDPRVWRLSMSDEIHPNMDGHKRLAEAIALAIGGVAGDLSDVPPPAPALPRTGERLARGEPIRVLAMTPVDAWVGPALAAAAPGAKVEVTPWPVDGRTLAQLDEDAGARVRPLTPDLVLLAVPRGARAESFEATVRHTAWIMNRSLSFGPGGWDCVVVHPSVVEPGAGPDDDLVRRLVRAQDLTLIDRPPGDDRPGPEILRAWLARRPWQTE